MITLRRAARLFALVAALSVLPASSLSASSPSGLEKTRREIRASRSRLAGALRTDAQITAALNAITAQLVRHQAALAAVQARLARIEAGMRAEERRIANLADQTSARTQLISDRARTLYMMGPGTPLEAILTAENLDEFVGRASMIEMVSSHDRRLLEELASIENEARRRRAALETKSAEVRRTRAEVAERVALVREIVQAKQEAHAAVERTIAGERDVLRALQREQARILALIRSRQSSATGPVSRRGFVWPIRGEITSPYGNRHGEFHTGIDIDCSTGAPIAASKAGRVIASEWGGGYGNMVIIDHGNGVSTLYAHMSRRYVSEGSRVDQRQRVGACGSTGRSTGDHLHFEVRVNGEPRNPRDFLP